MDCNEWDEVDDTIKFYQHPAWVVHLALEYMRMMGIEKPARLPTMAMSSVLPMKETDEGIEAWMDADRGNYKKLAAQVNKSGKLGNFVAT